MKKEALINDYITAVSSAVVCHRSKKKEILSQLRMDVQNFADENEGVTRQEIEAVFGSPEVIAASIFANIESVEIRKKVTMKRTIIAFVLTVLFIYIAFVVISLIDVHNEAYGHVEEGIMCISIWLKGGAL